jgi:hypothetical protein
MRTKRIVKDALVQVRLNRRERNRWAEGAAREDLTLAELVREAVRLRLASISRLEATKGDR